MPVVSTKSKPMENDTDSDDDYEQAQIRQFLEAADHTLLTNAMFETTVTTTEEAQDAVTPKAQAVHVQAAETTIPLKSERYLNEEDTIPSDIQVTQQMQAHVYAKLSAIINRQIEFCDMKAVEPQLPEQPNRVKLLSNADSFINTDLIETHIGPLKKYIIRKRQLEESTSTADALAAVVVSGEAVLSGNDMHSWAKRPMRQDKLFEYRACDAQGFQLKAKEPINEFTAQRRKNSWNESKIRQNRNKIKSRP